MKKPPDMTSPAVRLFSVVVCVVMAGVIGLGLWYSGNPWQARASRLDNLRSSDLVQIGSSLNNHWNRTAMLPAQLSDMASSTYPEYIDASYLTDPDTKIPFSYRVLSPNSYQLCATFDTDTFAPGPNRSQPYVDTMMGQADVWHHAKGWTCFPTTMTTSTSTLLPPPPKPL